MLGTPLPWVEKRASCRAINGDLLSCYIVLVNDCNSFSFYRERRRRSTPRIFLVLSKLWIIPSNNLTFQDILSHSSWPLFQSKNVVLSRFINIIMLVVYQGDRVCKSLCTLTKLENRDLMDLFSWAIRSPKWNMYLKRLHIYNCFPLERLDTSGCWSFGSIGALDSQMKFSLTWRIVFFSSFTDPTSC